MGQNGYAKDVLVSTDWLAGRLNDEGIVVAEVDESPELYDEGHIPGAVKLHWKDDLQDPLERDLIDREAFERLVSSRGISNDSTRASGTFRPTVPRSAPRAGSYRATTARR